jgi:hypothetical protein
MFMDYLHRYARTTPWLFIYIALAPHLGLSSFDLVIRLVPSSCIIPAILALYHYLVPLDLLILYLSTPTGRPC